MLLQTDVAPLITFMKKQSAQSHIKSALKITLTLPIMEAIWIFRRSEKLKEKEEKK